VKIVLVARAEVPSALTRRASNAQANRPDLRKGQALAQRRWDFALIQECYERYHWEYGVLEYPNLPEPVHTGLRSGYPQGP